MAAVTLTDLGQERVTLSGTPDTTQEFILPVWARHVSIIPQGNSVKFAMSGTEGGALGADYVTIADGFCFTREVSAPQGRNVGRSVFVASATASAVVVVIAERTSVG